MEAKYFSDSNIKNQTLVFMHHNNIAKEDVMTEYPKCRQIIATSMKHVYDKYKSEMRNNDPIVFLDKLNKKAVSNSLLLLRSQMENVKKQKPVKKDDYGVPSMSNNKDNQTVFRNPNDRFKAPQNKPPIKELIPASSSSGFASWDNSPTGGFSRADGEYGDGPIEVTERSNNIENNSNVKMKTEDLMTRVAQQQQLFSQSSINNQNQNNQNNNQNNNQQNNQQNYNNNNGNQWNNQQNNSIMGGPMTMTGYNPNIGNQAPQQIDEKTRAWLNIDSGSNSGNNQNGNYNNQQNNGNQSDHTQIIAGEVQCRQCA